MARKCKAEGSEKPESRSEKGSTHAPALSLLATRYSLLLHKIRHHRVAQLPQRLVLDLADALAGQADAEADLLERHRVLAVEAVAELEDLRLALVDVLEQPDQLPHLVVVHDDLVRRQVVVVGDDLPDRHFRPV